MRVHVQRDRFSREYREAVFTRRIYARHLETLIEKESERTRFDNMSDRDVARIVADKVTGR